ncbi:hypothetical protein [Mesoplasma coleopterae]|uniref:Uncharacterized protein n=1 Tax=Mesoplasma coleopterae TaxID=324078 RepID=A0A2K8P2N9_9MOLU|nr:hypothetical protein [Mesoplasma coleopterae]ATZ21031.1 hypothetical protein MCOLE_v1c05190 [Mesoplasma coleopterae]
MNLLANTDLPGILQKTNPMAAIGFCFLIVIPSIAILLFAISGNKQEQSSHNKKIKTYRYILLGITATFIITGIGMIIAYSVSTKEFYFSSKWVEEQRAYFQNLGVTLPENVYDWPKFELPNFVTEGNQEKFKMIIKSIEYAINNQYILA